MLATLTLGSVLIASEARGAPDVTAAVVVIDDLPSQNVVAAAAEQVPARWRLETLTSARDQSGVGPEDVDALLRAYLNADFLRCLAATRAPGMALDQLLAQGRRTEAATIGTITAACALGAGDSTRARELVRGLLARELDQPDILRKTTPDFQQLAEEERQVAQHLGRVTIEVRTEPQNASVRVDGAMRCPTSPCRFRVLHGEHLVTVEKLGRRSRSLTAMMDGDQALRLELEPASAEESRHQLALSLGAGVDPSGAETARTAAMAYGVGLLVLVWQRNDQVHASVFQRSAGALTHVAVDATGPDPAARAVTVALKEWHSQGSSRSMLRQPLFWISAVAIAVASAVAVYFVVRPREPDNVIIIR